MNSVVVFFILLGAFPFLFPEVCRVWLERAQQWLVAYEEKLKRQWRAERAVEAETQEWQRWIKHAMQTLRRTKTAEERVLVCAQLKAAGERFLAGVAQCEEGKPDHPAMKTAEEKTKAFLDLLNGGALDVSRSGQMKSPAKGARPSGSDWDARP
jgi:hypothetical protein